MNFSQLARGDHRRDIYKRPEVYRLRCYLSRSNAVNTTEAPNRRQALTFAQAASQTARFALDRVIRRIAIEHQAEEMR